MGCVSCTTPRWKNTAILGGTQDTGVSVEGTRGHLPQLCPTTDRNNRLAQPPHRLQNDGRIGSCREPCSCSFVIVQLMKTEVTLQLAPSGGLRGAGTERVHHTAQPHAPPCGNPGRCAALAL